jgi:hypothetical protein
MFMNTYDAIFLREAHEVFQFAQGVFVRWLLCSMLSTSYWVKQKTSSSCFPKPHRLEFKKSPFQSFIYQWGP